MNEMTELEKVQCEILDLQKAKEILEKIYLEIGGYGADKLTPETLRELNKYFKFDDSE